MKTTQKIFIVDDINIYKVNEFLKGENDARVVSVASDSKGNFLIIVEYKTY